MPSQAPPVVIKPEHRLDFFRPDQITFLVTHNAPAVNEPLLPQQFQDLSLSEWIAKLGEQMNDEQLSKMQVRDFIAGCNEELNNNQQLPDNTLKTWTMHFQNYLLQRNNEWMLVDPPPRSYSFPAVDTKRFENVPAANWSEKIAGAFSIIVCNVDRTQNQQSASSKASNNPAAPNSTGKDNQGNPQETNKERGQRKKDLLNLISVMDKEREALTTPELTVEVVSPNWVVNSTRSDSGGTGGPGGHPSPYTGTDLPEHIPYSFEKLIGQLKGGNPAGIDVYGDGEGVDVIILDTAPSSHDLVAAHKELVLIPEKNGKGHPLIKNLLGPDGRLKLYPASYEDHIRMGNTSLNKHGYKMTDHGLFIAGIIHSIVPKATIHLIEVLNQFGVGDLESLARGLVKAFEICYQNQSKAVINGSWGLQLPDRLKIFAYRPDPKEVIPGSEKDIEENLRKQIESELDALEKNFENPEDELRWVLELRVLCERLGIIGRQVVAAAGNQADNAGQSRIAPDAWYPAAFSKVVGVGAFPKNAKRNDGSSKYDASSYSNLADKPAQTGIMALGGEEGAEKGVLGVYIGAFPPVEDATGQPINGHGWEKSGLESENGWAWWAGTSFATPILTGTIASVLSGPANPGTTQRAVEILYTDCIIESALTERDEDGIPSSLEQSAPSSRLP